MESKQELVQLASRTLSFRVLLTLLPYVNINTLSEYDQERIFLRAVENKADQIIAQLKPRLRRSDPFIQLITSALRADDITAARHWHKELQEWGKTNKVSRWVRRVQLN